MKNNQNQSKLLKLNGDPTGDIKALINFSEQDQIDMDSNFTFLLEAAIKRSDIRALQAMKENKSLNKVFKDIDTMINTTYNKKKEEVMPALIRDVENVRSMQNVKNAYAALNFLTITKDQSPDSKILMADLALRSINIIESSTEQERQNISQDEKMMSVLEELEKSNPLQKSIFSSLNSLNFNQPKQQTQQQPKQSKIKLISATQPNPQQNQSKVEILNGELEHDAKVLANFSNKDNKMIDMDSFRRLAKEAIQRAHITELQAMKGNKDLNDFISKNSLNDLEQYIDDTYNDKKEKAIYGLMVTRIQSMDDVKKSYDALGSLGLANHPDAREFKELLLEKSTEIIQSSTEQERQNISQDEKMMSVLEELEKSNPLRQSNFSLLTTQPTQQTQPQTKSKIKLISVEYATQPNSQQNQSKVEILNGDLEHDTKVLANFSNKDNKMIDMDSFRRLAKEAIRGAHIRELQAMKGNKDLNDFISKNSLDDLKQDINKTAIDRLMATPIQSMENVKNLYQTLGSLGLANNPDAKKFKKRLLERSREIVEKSTEQNIQNIANDENLMYILEDLEKSNPSNKSLTSSLSEYINPIFLANSPSGQYNIFQDTYLRNMIDTGSNPISKNKTSINIDPIDNNILKVKIQNVESYTPGVSYGRILDKTVNEQYNINKIRSETKQFPEYYSQPIPTQPRTKVKILSKIKIPDGDTTIPNQEENPPKSKVPMTYYPVHNRKDKGWRSR